MHWFVVLPDCVAAQAVPRMLSGAALLASHASGRPWLIGRIPAEQRTVLTAGDQRLAVLGQSPGTAGHLMRLAQRVRGPRGLSFPTDALPGSAHLVLSVNGHVRAQGTASGLRRVYRTTWQGVTVAADRADVLAELTGAELDDRWLATTLLTSELPHPLNVRSPWRRIEAVPPGSALLITPDGRARLHRWWQPPAPVRSLAEGAPAVREALSAAVSARVNTLGAGQPLGCDLSGGLDSTSLCFLAHRFGAARLVTMTVQLRDPSNDDVLWADRAALSLPLATRLVLHSQALPAQYAALEQAPSVTDAPSLLLRSRAVLDVCAQRYACHRVTVHLAGHGGDEVLQAPPSYLRDLLRRDPLLVLRHSRGHRAHYRWPLSRMLHGLADRRSYARWLADETHLLQAPDTASPPLGWGPPLRMAPWATPRAVKAVAFLLEEAAHRAEPLAPERSRHQALHRIHTASQLYRLMRQDLAEPWIALPYLDDHVLEACLAVRPDERGTPWRYKPLLAAALDGIVPTALLNRTTKAGSGSDFYRGLRQHRRQLLDLVDQSQLAQRGLIDPVPLRAALLTPCSRTVQALENALAVEHWLAYLPPRPCPTHA
ncbi:asparagine synthase [Streptomyces luteoverticillatus]|uniref:asparagine synthase (glutamine-hydrolyzing) n=1 Tax=Streptomyces luteoverticillatus TaxID=66425 RepID=A0A3S9PBU2_STRLT|nr:asparagine synthase-related protein [Streptomyces luteoverticillatus]AZQ69865.1 asparagine synthase [Streptomyces luteoverticillatus]